MIWVCSIYMIATMYSTQHGPNTEYVTNVVAEAEILNRYEQGIQKVWYVKLLIPKGKYSLAKGHKLNKNPRYVSADDCYHVPVETRETL